jgi:energy-coupling factor transport system ATP-binding protein
MDRAHKDGLAERIGELAGAGAAVVVATHDTEFAASFADRVVLLGQGVVIGDGPPVEVLGGGRHFSTEVARVTGGAALLPQEAARLMAAGGPLGEAEPAADGAPEAHAAEEVAP